MGLRHRAVHKPRMHRIDPDVVFGVLDRYRLGKNAYRALGSVVAGRRAASHNAVDGGDVDDGAATGPSHLRDGGPDSKENSFHVDVHHPVPSVPVRLFHTRRGD